MKLMFLTYLIELLCPLNGSLVLIFVLSAIASIFYLFWEFAIRGNYYSSDMDRDGNLKPSIVAKEKKKERWGKNSIIVTIVSLVFVTFLPTEKTAYMMIGAYAAEEIVNSDVTAKIVGKTVDKVGKIADNTDEVSGKVLTIINQKLDKYIEEGSKK